MIINQNKPCLVCHSTDIRFLADGVQITNDILSESNYHLLECNQCKCWFKSTIPDQALLSKHYNGLQVDFLDWDNELVFPHHLLILKDLQKLNSGKILDVGCWTGNLLSSTAKLQKLEVYGLEPNVEAQKMAEKSGYQILGATTDDLAKTNFNFNRIYLIDVIEHLLNPAEVISHLTAKLQVGGRLILVTGNNKSWPFKFFKTQYWYFKYPDHLVFFNAQTIKKIIDNQNFRITSSNICHYNFTVKRSYQNLLITAKYLKDLVLGKKPYLHLSLLKDHLFVEIERIR